MSYQEIVTKAVIGKGRKSTLEILDLVTDKEVSKALGCWIINNTFKASYRDDKVFIEGQYEVNVWYAYEEDCKTDVCRYTQKFEEELQFKMKPGEQLSSKMELKAYCQKYPTCTGLKILPGGHIEVNVEKEYIIDAIGEAVLRVQLSQVVQDDWKLEDEIDKNVNTNYIK